LKDPQIENTVLEIYFERNDSNLEFVERMIEEASTDKVDDESTAEAEAITWYYQCPPTFTGPHQKVRIK
jgi:hypothetical protein